MKIFKITTSQMNEISSDYITIDVKAEYVEIGESESLVFRDAQDKILSIYKKDIWRSVKRIK